jgi:tetratricopeptide (TPR) repeat protein
MIMALLVFAGSFLCYLLTLNGTIPAYRDSGDLINAITTLGIAHPPGYPLYVLIGKLFMTAMPFANSAYRVNLLSAVSAAASAALLYKVTLTQLKRMASLKLLQRSDVVCRWDRARLACVIAAILYVLCPAVLMLGRVAEMYTLAALFGSLILGCYVWDTPRSHLLGCFLIGLGFGVHPVLLFFAPLFIPLSPPFKPALARAGFFIIGFTVVLFPLIRSGTGPVQNWGNPSTWQDLWRLITRSNYGGLKLHPVESQLAWTPAGVIDQAAQFSRLFFREWGWLGILAGLAGLVVYMKRNGRLFVAWLLLGPLFFILSNLPIQESTTVPILQPYLVIVDLIWALWIAQGVQALWSGSPRRTFAAALLLAGLGIVYTHNRIATFESYRNHFYAYDLGRNAQRTLPPRSVMYDPDDQYAFTLRALQLLEHRRTDIVLLNFFRTYWGYQQIVERWPDLLPPGPVHNAQELEQLFIRYSMKRRPFYADLPMKVLPPLSTIPEGLLYRITPMAQRLTDEDLRRAERFEPLYSWRGDWRTTHHEDFFTQHIINYRAASRCNLGLQYTAQQKWDAARALYVQAIAIDPDMAVAYNNLGVLEYQLRNYPQAIRNYQLAIRHEPDNPSFQKNLELARQAEKPR